MNTSPSPSPTASFDARPAIARGEEPLGAILKLAASLEDGDVLEVIAPFDPQPLYRVLGARGFRTPTVSRERTPGEWTTRFVRVAIAPTQTVSAVHARHPMTASVFAERGLDTCCGGGHTLEVAAAAHGVDLKHLLAALQGAALGVVGAGAGTQGIP